MPEPDPDEADKRQLAWLEKGWYEGALDFASGHGRMPDNGLSPGFYFIQTIFIGNAHLLEWLT